MTHFSNEILQLIFNCLESRDLKQCQLTSRDWYTPATENLYQYAIINNSYHADSLMRTIKDTPKLGALVKKVYIWKDEGIRKNQEILDFIIAYCPSVEAIVTQNDCSLFWARMLNAGYQGELPNLRYLQSIAGSDQSRSLDYYNYTALAFRETLQTLELWDQICCALGGHYKKGNLYADGFSRLAQRLQEFANLQELKIYRHSERGLIESETLIERCPKLSKVYTYIVPPRNTSFVNDDHKLDKSSIIPRPDITSFEGHPIIMDHYNSLFYLMHKFPNLQTLKLKTHQYDYIHSLHGSCVDLITTIRNGILMKDFFSFLTKIPLFAIDFSLQDLRVEPVIDFMLQRSVNRLHHKIILEYQLGRDVCFEYNAQSTKLRFPYRSADSKSIILPHVNFVEQAGYLIEKLVISKIETVQGFIPINDKESPTTAKLLYGDWLPHLFKNCPNLKELEIRHPRTIQLNADLMEEHASLEKLSFYSYDGFSVLTDLSLCLPSLKHFRLHNQHFLKRRPAEVVSINMPHTTFDTLTISSKNDDQRELVGIGFELYVKVTINAKSEAAYYFYTADALEAKHSTEDVYDEALKSGIQQCFDICCKSLKELRIIHKHDFNMTYHLNLL